MKIHLPDSVTYIIQKLQDCGFSAYAVGGCIRDSLMGKCPHDWDICTAASPQQVMEVFAGSHLIETGLQHGTVTLMLHHEGYEITTYRTDGRYSDGRHPDQVSFVSEVEEDLARRDFTVNAMAYNDSAGLVDLFGGLEDLEKGVIRCVRDPEERFEEDVLRIMRAVRFASVFGFSVEKNTARAIHRRTRDIHRVSVERITSEFRKMAAGKAFPILAREYTDLITEIIPEFRPALGFEQKNRWHSYDVWEHTMRVVEGIRPESCREEPWRTYEPMRAACVPEEVLREIREERGKEVMALTLLFHDIGKPYVCREVDGVRHFKGHAPKGAELTDRILTRLRFDNNTRKQVTELILHHDDNWHPSRKMIRRTISAIGKEQTGRLMLIRYCDILAQNPACIEDSLKDLAVIKDYYDRILEEENCFTLADLAVSGSDLIALGMKPGPDIGETLQKMLELVLNEECENDREQLLAGTVLCLHFLKIKNKTP